MKDLPYYRMWVKDFDTNEAVRSLNLAEAGLFLFALNHAWINDGIPESENEIGRILKLTVRQMKQLWPRVSLCFYSDGKGRLRNKRQEEERVNATKKSKQASDAVAERERKRLIEKASSDDRPMGFRSSSDDLRARTRADSDSVVDSVSDKNEIPLVSVSQSEWPITAAEIRKHDSACDDFFVLKLVQATVQACISDDKIPPGEVEKITDDLIADAVRESFEKYTGRNGHGTGLLLTRVPQIVKNWAKEPG